MQHNTVVANTAGRFLQKQVRRLFLKTLAALHRQAVCNP